MDELELKIELVRQRRRQIEVAHAAGIEPTRLNRILNGWIVPSDEEISAIKAQLHRETDCPTK